MLQTVLQHLLPVLAGCNCPHLRALSQQLISQAPKMLCPAVFSKKELLLPCNLSGEWAQITQLLLLLPPPLLPEWIPHHPHLSISLMFSLMSWVGGSDLWSSVSELQRTLETQGKGLVAVCLRQVLGFYSIPSLSSKPNFLETTVATQFWPIK